MAAAKKKPRTADMSGAVQPTVRTFTTWTPALIRSAEIQADAGNLRYAANICDWLLTNPIVFSALRARFQSLLGLDPTFERSGDKRRSGRAVKALEVGEDWWAAYPESELMQLLIWGFLLGVTPANQAPWTRGSDLHPVGSRRQNDHGGRVLPTFENWHPQHLRYDNPTRTWRIKVASSGGYGGETEEELVPGDGTWILHTPFGKNRPWAWGAWRTLADLVLLAEYGWQDWGRVSERAILLVLTCLNATSTAELQGYTKTAREQLAANIYARGSAAVAALPPGIDLKAVQAAVDAQKLQGSLIEAAHKAIAIVIRGGNLSTDSGDKGARSLGETQAAMGDIGNLKFDAQSLTTTIHDQSLTWWAQFNYGDASLAPWPVYPVEPQEDRKAKGDTEEKALANLDAAEKLGLDVDRAAWLESYSIEWADPGERPPAPVAVPPPPPEQGVDPEADPDELEDEPPEPQARALEGRAEKPDGFANGNNYADRLHKRAVRHGAKELAPTLAAVIAVIRNAKDYEDAEKKLIARYGKLLPPTELASLLDASLTMGQLGGALSVIEDSPEIDGAS